MMDANEFLKLTGSLPEHDDLERVNCDKSHTFGHTGCGLCPACGQPRFMCVDHETHEPDRFRSLMTSKP